MKILFLFLVPFIALGEFQPRADIGTCNNRYAFKKMCDERFANTCEKLTVDCNYAKLESQNVEVDDFDKPIYIDSEIESCIETKKDVETCPAVLDDVATATVNEALTPEENCQILIGDKTCEEGFEAQVSGSELSCVKSKEVDCLEKLQSKSCADQDAYAFYSVNDFKLICRKGNGFEKKTVVQYSIVEDSVKKTKYQSKKLEEAAMKVARERRDHGSKVIDLMLYRNSLKPGLTKKQIKDQLSLYSGIKAMLETGSLNTAKDEIEALIPDGVLVTAEDKTKLIEKINEYKDL